MPNPQWIVSQIGAREHYAVARALADAGHLYALYTDVWAGAGRTLLGKGPKSLRAFAGRAHPDLAGERVVAFTGTALWNAVRVPLAKRLFRTRTDIDGYITVGEQFAQNVRRSLEQQRDLPGELAFFGYNTGCLETLEWLNDRGIPSVVDQIDPGRVEIELLIEETRRWPGWTDTMPVIHAGYYDRLSAEWAAATLVLVNSEWSRQALVQQGVPDEKIIVVPLAYEPPSHVPPRERKHGGPLRVLWLGQVNLRKGIQYLVDAAHRLPGKDYAFTIAGPLGITPHAVSTAPENMRFAGRVTRDQLSEYYSQADVFVLPTLSDGFAITQLEAMAHGVPVIATPNCGEVVTDGVDGLIVEAGNGESLAEALAWCHGHREALVEMGQRARQKLTAYTLGAYAERLNAAYSTLTRISN